MFAPAPNATPFEAQAVPGDSGGAVFAQASADESSPRKWELVGMMFAVTNYGSGKDDVSLFGSYSYAADLAHYCDQIL